MSTGVIPSTEQRDRNFLFPESLSTRNEITGDSMQGKAYKLIFDARRRFQSTERNDELSIAFNVFLQVSAARSDVHASDLYKRLHAEFNVDCIIDFSSAWRHWQSLSERLHQSDLVVPVGTEEIPLDQQLFRGLHPNASAYLDGIERLANGQVRRVGDWLRLHLPKRPATSLLDLGAGPAVYSRWLVENGIVDQAVCVDFEPAVRRATRTSYNAGRLKWLTSDIFELSISDEVHYDAIYVGNLFHHYSLADNVSYLERISKNTKQGTILMVQDYLLANDVESSPLHAAALGLHFALTSGGGRCYTEREISSAVSTAFPTAKHRATGNIGLSDLLLFEL